MIVKFHNRGVGRGSGPVEYLLGRDGQREGATLDRGNPAEVQALIDSSSYAKKYTSGVLSFSESDLDRETKDKLMDSFEKTLLPGLDKDQYSCLWVEHRDKGRLELNFVVPNVELQTGKRLQPYYDKADRPRVNAWKVGKNAELGLHDPDDPMNKRELVTPRSLPQSKQAAARAITDGLLSMAAGGEIRGRGDVVKALSGAGFEVVRQTKKSISIADPEGGRNIRLKGRIYEQDFRFGAELRAEIEAASERYRAESQERIRAARESHQRGFERKREENQRRYKRPERAPEPFGAQDMAMAPGHGRSGADSSLGRGLVAGRDDSRQLAGNQQAESRPGEAGSQDMGPRTERGRKGPIYSASEGLESGSGLERRRQASSETGEKLNDGARAAAIERIRAITERTREAAQRICRGLRELSLHVRVHEAGERRATPGSERLERAGRALGERVGRFEQQNRAKQEMSRGMSR